MAGTDKKPNLNTASETSAEASSQSQLIGDQDHQILNGEQLQIINWLKNIQFRKQFFGGVNEQDVWKKIEKLNEMYEAALKAERIRYDVLLEEQSNQIDPILQPSDPTKEVPVDE